jgi:hypothetical protein
MMNGENVVHQKTSAPLGKVKPWEHVWSIDEMRKDASNWHLASDVGVGCSFPSFIMFIAVRLEF